MTDKEAMQMALETAEQIASADYRHWGELASLGEFERWARSRANHIAEALRARLAQPENKFNPDWDAIAVMVEEQQRMAKRIEELTQLVTSQGIRLMDAEAQLESELFEYWNAVEGWVKIDEVRQHFDTAGCGTIYKTGGEGRVPLYTTPQREWVGLTDDEIWKDDGIMAANSGYGATFETLRELARAIEAKLKEKNT